MTLTIPGEAFERDKIARSPSDIINGITERDLDLEAIFHHPVPRVNYNNHRTVDLWLHGAKIYLKQTQRSQQ